MQTEECSEANAAMLAHWTCIQACSYWNVNMTIPAKLSLSHFDQVIKIDQMQDTPNLCDDCEINTWNRRDSGFVNHWGCNGCLIRKGGGDSLNFTCRPQVQRFRLSHKPLLAHRRSHKLWVLLRWFHMQRWEQPMSRIPLGPARRPLGPAPRR